MKIGDKVRFLSEVGGGVVTGFQGKNIVLVEDADGFDIPMPINECVVIETDDYNIPTPAAKAAAQTNGRFLPAEIPPPRQPKRLPRRSGKKSNNCVRPLLRQGRLLWILRFQSLKRSVWRNRRYLFIVSPR